MNVTLNNKPYPFTEGTALDAFIESLGIPLQGIAIAIDYEVIPKNRWKQVILTNGMALMLIQATSGG